MKKRNAKNVAPDCWSQRVLDKPRVGESTSSAAAAGHIHRLLVVDIHSRRYAGQGRILAEIAETGHTLDCSGSIHAIAVHIAGIANLVADINAGDFDNRMQASRSLLL